MVQTAKTARTLKRRFMREQRLNGLRDTGRAAGLSEQEIALAERSLAEAFALADFIDAVRELAE